MYTTDTKLCITNTANVIWIQGQCDPVAVLRHDQDAHTIAETLCYLAKHNCVYGLHGYRIGSWAEFLATLN